MKHVEIDLHFVHDKVTISEVHIRHVVDISYAPPQAMELSM
jgi:hypothetical protein